MWKEVPTPAVIIDETVLVHNLRRMQAYADEQQVVLRPHIKTHKSREIGKRQLREGADGITVATIEEALHFLEGDFSSITLAYPIVEAAPLRNLLWKVKDRKADLRLIVDSWPTFKVAQGLSEALAYPLKIYAKIDVGLHRCGFSPDDPTLLAVVRAVVQAPYLTFWGVLSHAGQSYGAADQAVVAAIAREEIRILRRVRDRLLEENISVPASGLFERFKIKKIYVH